MLLVENVSHYCNVAIQHHPVIPLRTLRYYDFTFVVEGHMTYTVNGEEYVLGPNDAIFLPPGTLESRQEGTSPTRFVSFNFTAAAGADLNFPMVMRGLISRDMITLASVFPRPHISHRDRSLQKVTSMLNYMLYELQEICSYGTCNPYVLQALRYMEDHLDQPISLAQISQHLNLSKEYTATLFKAETGKTVMQTILEKKMQQAKDLLKYQNGSIQEVASSLGFENYSYFCRTFKKHFEISPAKYRTRFRKQD